MRHEDAVDAGIAVCAATAAAFAYLPYSWAHLAAGSISAALVVFHVPVIASKNGVANMSEEKPENPETPEPVQNVGPNPGLVLMGLAAPTPFPVGGTIQVPREQNPVRASDSVDNAAILTALNAAHAESMEVLNRIWEHLTTP